MIPWTHAYDRLKGTPEFAQYFGKLLPMGAFRFLAYSMQFAGVTGSATAGTFGTQSGPLQQNFPSGAIILGITASAFQAQQAHNAADYAPSYSPGRRDLFGLSIQYTGDEQITPNGLTMAEALMGSGEDTIFPAKEILIPPSKGLLIATAALTGSGLPSLAIHVAFHCMVPRAVG